MKKNQLAASTARAATLAAVIASLASLPASAEIIANEDFEIYPNSTLIGNGSAGAGWAGPWAAGPVTELTTEVKDTSTTGAISITPSGGQAVAGGKRALDVYPPASSGSTPVTGIAANRQLATHQTATFYAAFVIHWNSGSFNSGDTFALHFTNNAADETNGFNFGYRGQGGTYGVMARKGTGNPVAGANSTFTTNTAVRYLVAKFEKSGSANYNKITVWVNPGINSEAMLPNGDCQLSGVDSGIAAISSINLLVEGLLGPDAGSNGNDKVRLDSLAVATRFSDLMGNAREARPFIWVRAPEKQDILAKIAGNSWATSVYNGMVNRVASDVASHQSNRDSFLRQLPAVWTSSPAKFKTIPTYTESSVSGAAESKFNDGVDCAVLYYLTGDTKYARCAADILHNAVKTILPVNPSTSVGNGGWIWEDDFLYEARKIGTQLPIIYDFIYPYLQANQVYDVQTAGMVNFSFTNAQNVFRTYYELARDHGSKDSNWSALMSTCMLNCILALDDATERAAALQVYLTTGGPRQASLEYDYRHYLETGNVWPESLQYASAVGEIRSAHMVLLERYDPSLSLFETYPNLPLSLPRIRDFRYPNGKDQISFGDGHRSREGQSFFEYELLYRHAKDRGYDELTTLMGGLINGGIADNEYNRSSLSSYSSLGRHDSPLQLLWQAPVVAETPVPLVLPRTDRIPFAGIALQRNESPNGDPDYGLMGFVGGGAFVHSHASGMSMELYGMGEVMGAKAGRTSYGTTLHNNFYRLFSANNTIIVNGASIGEGGWQSIATNTVNTVSMEPQPRQSAVSRNLSFTTTSFNDNKGNLAEAVQQRTLAIVRTSDTTGFYVDLFRSNSSVTNRTATTLNGNVTDQFHDYIYRNIGDLTMIIEANGASLPLIDQPNRFQNDVGASYAQPGWRYFSNTKVSQPHQADLFAQFKATPSGSSSIYMDMHMPAISMREVAKADSPDIVNAPAPYDGRNSPTLVIRRIGEAWNEPFVSVFEPHLGVSGGTIVKTTALWRDGTVVGVKVESIVAGSTVNHYIISNPTDDQTYADPLIDLSFRGRFGIIADFGNGNYELYIGDGRSVSYRGNTLSSVAGDTEASMVVRRGTEPVVTANGTVNVLVPGPYLGPLAHWPLDEGTGTTTANVANVPQIATLRNGATWGSDGTRASFVSFDGEDDRISTNFTYALGAEDDFTWAWWANKQSPGGSDNGAIMIGNRYPEGTPGERYEFIKFTPIEAQFANTESSASIDRYNYDDVPQDGWHHYAMVKTGTSYQWYVDGVTQGSPVTRPYAESAQIPFHIGGDDDDATPGGRAGEHFLGSIDDVVLYNRALNPSGVNKLMNGIHEIPFTTALEEWRMLYFETMDNIGTAADSYDADSDGEANLLEFATGQNPLAGTLVKTTATHNGANLEFRYSRSTAAIQDGIQFTVEWSDTLQDGSWSGVGVIDTLDQENPGNGVVESRIAILPIESKGRCFLHLMVRR